MNKKDKKREKTIDSDKDGLSDWEEVHIYGTNPNNPDTDGDGMSDGAEVRAGRNPKGPGMLKDIFIPHEGNDYRPHSLRLKRLLFHGISAIVIKSVVVLFVISYPITAWLTPDVIVEQGKKIIALTNELRKSLSLPALKESNKLNQAAYAKMQDMFLGQYFAHVSPSQKDLGSFLKQVGYDYNVAGENLAMGYNRAEDAVEAWRKSPTHYENLSDKDFREIGVSLAVDIFEKENTVLAAQYFGQPKKTEQAPVVNPVKSTKRTVVKKTDSGSVLAAREPKKAAVKVVIDKPAAKKENLIKVQAILPAETKEAKVEILKTEIPLVKNESGEWSGGDIIKDDVVSSPIVPASITMTDNQGNQETSDIESQAIKSRETSLVNQYFLLRNNPNSSIEKIFDISSIYFKSILFLAIISLLLNVFIQVKKQHPHLIASGLGLVFLLLILIVF